MIGSVGSMISSRSRASQRVSTAGGRPGAVIAARSAASRRAALLVQLIALDIGLQTHELGALDPPLSVNCLVRLVLVPEPVQRFIGMTLRPEYAILLHPDGASGGRTENLDLRQQRVVDRRGLADRLHRERRDRIRAPVDPLFT